MTTTANERAQLTQEERADSAAQSLHSAVLDGHEVSPATQADTELYVSGELTADDVLRRALERHDVA